MNSKSKIFFSVWCCAYQRRWIYKGTGVEEEDEIS